MALDTDRARRWIGALGVHQQAAGRLVNRTPDGGLCFCWLGSGAECASHDGYTRRVEGADGPDFTPTRWDDQPITVFGAVSAWVGVDVLDIRCHVRDLPAGIRAEVEQDLGKLRGRKPLLAELERFEQCGEHGHPLWLLNDCGVLAATLADVMRVVLDVDRDEVPE